MIPSYLYVQHCISCTFLYTLQSPFLEIYRKQRIAKLCKGIESAEL